MTSSEVEHDGRIVGIEPLPHILLTVRSEDLRLTVFVPHRKRRRWHTPEERCSSGVKTTAGRLYEHELPGEMTEGLVSFGHTVNVLTSGDGSAFSFVGVEQFLGQPLVSGSAFASARGLQDPAYGQ